MTGKLNSALACATTLRQLNDGETIRNAAEHMVLPPDMAGEKSADENTELLPGFWETSILMYPDSKLKEQVRDFEDTPSVFEVLAEAFGFRKSARNEVSFCYSPIIPYWVC